MSAFGVQSFDGSGALLFDSSTAIGGIIIDFRQFAAADSGTYTYPSYAGYTPFFVSVGGDGTMVLDTSLGYPRVTVSTSTVDGRRYLLGVY